MRTALYVVLALNLLGVFVYESSSKNWSAVGVAISTVGLIISEKER